MKQTIRGKLYDTEKATCIADDRYWDGHNFERSGRNTYLYLTPNGNYFEYSTTQWQGERDTIEPVGKAEAKALWEELPEHNGISYEEAFPGEKVTEA